MVDDRDVAGGELLDQVLGAVAEPRDPLDRRLAAAPLRRESSAGSDGGWRWPPAQVSAGGSAASGALRRPRAARGRGGRRLAEPAAQHAADLLDHALALEPLDVRRRGSPSTSFSSRKWTSASEATCGRWVMQMTWRPSPSARRRSPTTRAVLPPTPASISSKTRVPAPAARPRPLSASITRESSPPEAASRSGAASIPGFGRDPQLDRLAAAGAEAVGVRLEHDLERRARPSRAARALRRPALPAAPRPRARPALSSLAQLLAPRLGLGQRRLGLGAAHLGALQPRDLGPAALGVREHRLDAAAVLALEPVDRLQALLDRRQRAGSASRPSA